MTAERWQRICAVLDRVLDADVAERDTIVADACRREGLAVDEVARLVATIGQDPEFLHQLPPTLLTDVLGALSDPPFAPGTQLGRYEVLEPIGAGGMGEVYRARDPKLERDVALKVLPDRFAIDADRLARFRREAQALAALNHPGIAGIYGLEEVESPTRRGDVVHAIALELVEGPTLADRLSGGALPLATALAIARQLIDALEAAHGAGIVHRDLKPANIKLRESGEPDDVIVKVLDFGLAKVVGPVDDVPPTTERHAQTVTSPTSTSVGVLLGTAAYMAPEQVKGHSVDARVDVWAFGCVLYEMVTGVRAFPGESVPETLGRIVTADPDWGRLPADTSDPLRRLLRRCLEKDRRRRLAHIADARFEVEDAERESAERRPSRTARPSARVYLRWTLAGAVLALGVAVVGWWARAPAESPLVVRFTVPLPGNIDVPAVSPDGSRVAYVVRVPSRRIIVRRVDASQSYALSGTEDAVGPAFSPDGEWIVYRTTLQTATAAGISRLKKIRLDGSAPQTLVDSIGPSVTGRVVWGEDGYIYYDADGELWRVRADGGAPDRLPDSSIRLAQIIQVLPGGRWLLMSQVVAATGPGGASPTGFRGPGQGRGRGEGPTGLGSIADFPLKVMVVAFNLETHERRDVYQTDLGVIAIRYMAAQAGSGLGYLVYGRGSAIWAVEFDPSTLTSRGPEVRLLDMDAGGSPLFSPTTRTLAYVARRAVATHLDTLVWVDRQGTERPIPAPPRVYDAPAISPDGRRVALRISRSTSGDQPAPWDVWTCDLETGSLKRVTFEERGVFGGPAWRRDGSLAYVAIVGDEIFELRAVVPGADGPPVSLLGHEMQAYQPTSFAPDGNTLAGFLGGSERSRPSVRIFALLEPVGSRTIDLDPRMVERDPRFAPDGSRVAYESNRSGHWEIWVTPFPHPENRWQQVSADGGTTPRWGTGGRELFYRRDGRVMAVRIAPGPAFSAGTPKEIFSGPYEGAYDVDPTRPRFLMLKPEGGAPPRTDGVDLDLHVVVNWLEESATRAATNR